MPIAAAAKKIKREQELFGFPPVFPVEEEKKEEKSKLLLFSLEISFCHRNFFLRIWWKERKKEEKR